MTKMEKATQSETAPAVRAPDSGDWLDRWAADWRMPRFWPNLRRVFGESNLEPLRVEEFTEGDSLIVRAEMPGIDTDKDVQISVTDHTLQLRAERREESKTEEKGAYRSEFRYGSFARTVPLPVGATDKDVEATYKDGILEVRIPIDRGEAEAKKIPIQKT